MTSLFFSSPKQTDAPVERKEASLVNKNARYVLVETSDDIEPNRSAPVGGVVADSSSIHVPLSVRVKNLAKSGRLGGIVRMPSMVNTIVGTKTFRIYGNATAGVESQSFDSKDLLYLQCVSTATNTVSSLFGSVRLRKVSVFLSWSEGNGIYEASAQIIPQGTLEFAKRETRTGAISTSAAGSYITWTPPKNTDLGWWHGDPSLPTNLFTLKNCFAATSTTGSEETLTVVDLTVDYTFCDANTAPFSTASTGAVLGTYYSGIPATSGATKLSVAGFTSVLV